MGYDKIVDIVWGSHANELFWGSFLIFRGFFKAKVQNLNIFGGC